VDKGCKNRAEERKAEWEIAVLLLFFVKLERGFGGVDTGCKNRAEERKADKM